jgi:hypothetical protein
MVWTLGDARDEWLRHIEFDRRRRAPSATTEADPARYLLTELGADLPLDQLTIQRIEAWQQRLLEAGELSPRHPEGRR